MYSQCYQLSTKIAQKSQEQQYMLYIWSYFSKNCRFFDLASYLKLFKIPKVGNTGVGTFISGGRKGDDDSTV